MIDPDAPRPCQNVVFQSFLYFISFIPMHLYLYLAVAILRISPMTNDIEHFTADLLAIHSPAFPIFYRIIWLLFIGL